MKTLILIGLILIGTASQACQFNTDCSPGSRCVKWGGNLYGICKGGLFPGNDYDQQPAHGTGLGGDKLGETCSFDTDCFPLKCRKGSSIYGVCQ